MAFKQNSTLCVSTFFCMGKYLSESRCICAKYCSSVVGKHTKVLLFAPRSAHFALLSKKRVSFMFHLTCTLLTTLLANSRPNTSILVFFAKKKKPANGLLVVVFYKQFCSRFCAMLSSNSCKPSTGTLFFFKETSMDLSKTRWMSLSISSGKAVVDLSMLL